MGTLGLRGLGTLGFRGLGFWGLGVFISISGHGLLKGSGSSAHALQVKVVVTTAQTPNLGVNQKLEVQVLA